MISDFAVTEAEETLMESYRNKKLSQGMKKLEPRKPGKASGTDDAVIKGYCAGSKAQLHHAVTRTSEQLAIAGAKS
ncbi:hypothetical protein AB4I99_08260 [Citrobacter murliniae]